MIVLILWLKRKAGYLNDYMNEQSISLSNVLHNSLFTYLDHPTSPGPQ